VISESTARRFWPQENPIGQRIGIGAAARQATTDGAADFPQYEIIGLANDTRQGMVWRPDETWLYLPMSTARPDVSNAGQNLIVSAENDVRAVMRAAQKEASALDPGLLMLMRLVDDALDTQMIPFQDIALLAGALGLLALALASIGLYLRLITNPILEAFLQGKGPNALGRGHGRSAFPIPAADNLQKEKMQVRRKKQPLNCLKSVSK